MVVVTPTAGLDYYLEDEGGTMRWDSFFVSDLIPSVRVEFHTSGVTDVAGISGGGYGALKLAFAHPDRFAAVAVMQPMLEPGLRESDVGARNRLHHAAGGTPKLIGPTRDAALWEANNPANRARANAQAIRDSRMAIYLEAAGHDFPAARLLEEQVFFLRQRRGKAARGIQAAQRPHPVHAVRPAQLLVVWKLQV